MKIAREYKLWANNSAVTIIVFLILKLIGLPNTNSLVIACWAGLSVMTIIMLK